MTLVEMRFEGVLTTEALHAGFSSIQPAIDGSAVPVVLLVDCRGMTDYTIEARAAFVAWNIENRPRIRRVAIVTARPLWQMVVSAMALATSQALRPFSDVDAARKWLLR